MAFDPATFDPSSYAPTGGAPDQIFGLPIAGQFPGILGRTFAQTRPWPGMALGGAPGDAAPAAPNSGVTPGGSPEAPAQPDSSAGGPPGVPQFSLLGRIISGLGGLNAGLGRAFNPMSGSMLGPTLMAMGGGMAGAPSIGTGISRALTAGAPMAQQQQQFMLKLMGMQAMAEGMRQRGIPEEQIQASIWGGNQAQPRITSLAPQTAVPAGVLPPNIAGQPFAAKLQLAPEGTPYRGDATGRNYVKRGGQWIATDTGQPVPMAEMLNEGGR